MKKLKNIYNNYHPSKWEAYSFLLIPILIGLMNSSNAIDDAWFILATGRKILNTGFFTIDPFTIHNGLHIVVQQWLFDVISYLIYDCFGKMGIYIFVNIFGILTIIIIYKLLMLVTNNNRKNSMIFTDIIGFLYCTNYLLFRPQIISTPLLLLELYYLEKYFKENNKKYLIALPIISIIAINVHAAIWPMLICIIIPFILNTFSYKIGRIESSKREKKPLLIALLAIIIVGLINPYGINALLYLINSLSTNILCEVVPEMRALNINTTYGKLSFIIIASICLFYIINKNKIQSRHLLLFLGTAYLSFSTNRGILFLIITSIYPLSMYLNNKLKRVKENSSGIGVFIFALVVLVIVPFVAIIETNSVSMKNDIEDHIDFIYKQENGNTDNIRLYCAYAVCTYAEYIGIKPYMDARAEVFSINNNKKDDIITEFYFLQRHQVYYKDFINKYDFNYLIVNNKDYLYLNLLHDDDYEMIYNDKCRPKNLLKYKISHKSEFSNYYVFKKKEKNS